MILKYSLCLALAAATFATAHAQIITTFGEDAESYGTWTYHPATSVLEGSASSGDLLFGSSASIDLAGSTGLALHAEAEAGLSGSFQILLEDGGGNSAWTDFYWEDFAGGASVAADFSLIDDGFDFSGVTGWSLINGAMGNDIHLVMGSLSAVPEPSILALAAVGLGFLLLKRRRAKGE